jgi:hypothetical protein
MPLAGAIPATTTTRSRPDRVASLALPPGVSAQCYYFDDEPFFGGDPHPPPCLYFDEDVLVSLMIWGQLGCPVTPPGDINHVGDLEVWSQHEGCQLGRWTVVSDHDQKGLGLNRDHVGVFFEKNKITERLPGIRIKYGQFATGKSWLWLLTDERLGPPPSFVRNQWGVDPVTVRLGRWPD